jgi:hypothetical protein
MRGKPWERSKPLQGSPNLSRVSFKVPKHLSLQLALTLTTFACLICPAVAPVPLPSRSDFAKMTPLEKARWAAKCMTEFQQQVSEVLGLWGPTT